VLCCCAIGLALQPEYLQENPNGMCGWDQTFRVRGWKQAMGEWAACNAASPPLDLQRLRELPCLDVRGTSDQVIKCAVLLVCVCYVF
jgi:hypothetical protein